MRRRTSVPALLAVLTCAACGASPAGPAASRSVVPVDDGRVLVRAGQVEVRAEVADDDAERAVGLMRRDEVPPGTGMVFRYDAPVDARYYMYDVRVPLTAVFARDGRVVGVVEMPPCPATDPAACPTYGPGEPFDTVLEAAPASLAGVERGDRLEVLPGE